MKTINIFNFNELNDSAKQTAINNYRNNYYDYNMESFNEYAKELIQEKGFKDKIVMNYSLSYSQGDGLSFSANNYNKIKDIFIEILGENKTKTIDTIMDNCNFIVKGNTGRYCFASFNDVEYELSFYANVKNPKRIYEIIEKVQNKISEIYVTLCNELEQIGYADIEYQNSDEYISEILEINEYEFLESGQKI